MQRLTFGLCMILASYFSTSTAERGECDNLSVDSCVGSSISQTHLVTATLIASEPGPHIAGNLLVVPLNESSNPISAPTTTGSTAAISSMTDNAPDPVFLAHVRPIIITTPIDDSTSIRKNSVRPTIVTSNIYQSFLSPSFLTTDISLAASQSPTISLHSSSNAEVDDNDSRTSSSSNAHSSSENLSSSTRLTVLRPVFATSSSSVSVSISITSNLPSSDQQLITSSHKASKHSIVFQTGVSSSTIPVLSLASSAPSQATRLQSRSEFTSSKSLHVNITSAQSLAGSVSTGASLAPSQTTGIQSGSGLAGSKSLHINTTSAQSLASSVGGLSRSESYTYATSASRAESVAHHTVIIASDGVSSKPASSRSRSSSHQGLASATLNSSASRTYASAYPSASTQSIASNILYTNRRCLTDSVSARTLNSTSFYQGSNTNSVEACALYCYQNGFNLAGAEYATECYCAAVLSSIITSSACTMSCPGNSSEACGGSDALTVVDVNLNYNTLDANAPNGYQGCFVDGFLKNATFRSGNLTIGICNDYCSGIGYAYAGTEYGTNCFCGALGSVPMNLQLASNCYAPCFGDSSQDCGGNGVMSIYKNPIDLEFKVPYTDGGKTSSSATNIFASLPANPPSSIFPQRPHDILPLGIDSTGPIHTNKQYVQAFYGSRQQILTMVPYIVNWLGNSFAIQHSDANQYTLAGVATNGVGASSYGGPLAQAQMVLSSVELLSDQPVNMTADSSLHASINLNMFPATSPGTNITMPMVNGMGLVTAHYNGLTPVLLSQSVHIESFSYVPAPKHSGIIQKMRFQLSDSSVWVMYLIPIAEPATDLNFTVDGSNAGRLLADFLWSGTVQVAKLPTASDPVAGERVLDQAAGTWVTSMHLSGSTSGSSGTYSFNFKKEGNTTKSPLVFALPHHVEILSNGGATGLMMQSPITGVAHGYITDSLTMYEPELPTTIGFIAAEKPNWSNATLLAIKKAITPDIRSSSAAGCNEYSVYSSGKCLARWGQLCLVAKDIVRDSILESICTESFRSVFSQFTGNTQAGLFNYETSWKGLVSAAGFATSGADYGATDYNDHHFHYGYVIYAAAVMAYLDPAWLTQSNIDWVNTLVRDVANPAETDPYFPQFRSMDWYIGHSVAHGIKDDESSGKDQESSSEDYNLSYGLKLWGHVTGNENLEGLGNVMCAVNMRSMNNYILLGPNNTNVPYAYAINYANGVTYANSMGYFTFFGAQPQYVHGIHMIPLTAMSPYIRKPAFVEGEYESLLKPLSAEIFGTGWSGIISSNLAISDSHASWEYFTNGSIVDFNYYNLDEGQSLSWALTFAAGLGGGDS